MSISQVPLSRDYLRDRCHGCLAMAAIGDALGMPTHDLTAAQIRARFNGPVTDFRPAPAETRVHPGFEAGQVTDDTWLTLSVARACLAAEGRLDSTLVARLTAEEFGRQERAGRRTMFGTTTISAVEAVRSGRNPVATALADTRPTVGSTNGGAMKIAPVGLLHAGRPEEVVDDVLAVCLPTHATQTAISAAAAIAAGVAEAVRPGADVFSVVRACLAGALAGEEAGRRQARTVALASVPARMKLALSLALSAASDEQAVTSLADLIGGSLAAHESIPAAVALFARHGQDPLACVRAGANYHYDTDTIANMVGALSGALHGIKGVPPQMLDRVETVNGLGLKSLAEGLADKALASRAG